MKKVARFLENDELPDRASWMLQMVDVYGVEGEPCQVAGSVQRNDVPCARNPDGVCDIGYLASAVGIVPAEGPIGDVDNG